MNQIPDGWPLDDDVDNSESASGGESGTAMIETPVFPLTDAFLFPGQVLPLRIFEPRYCAMIEDSLDGPGRIVIAATRTTAGTPELPALAGLGEIARHEKVHDGLYHVWLGGIARVRIEEIESDRPYRKVRCQVADDMQPDESESVGLRAELTAAIRERVDIDDDVAEDLPIGLLADLLAQCTPLPPLERAAVFAESDVSARAQRALNAHRADPPNGGGPDVSTD